jgi:hypothetical protein
VPFGGAIWLTGFLTLAPTASPAKNRIPIRVVFDAPAGCSDAEAFMSGVLGRTDLARRAGAGEPGLSLSVRLGRSGARVRGELRLGDESRGGYVRKVEGASCAEVVEVLSLSAALALDPSARPTPTPRPPATAVEPSPPDHPPSPPPPSLARPASPATPPPAPPPPAPAASAAEAAAAAGTANAGAAEPPPALRVSPPAPRPRHVALGLELSAVGAEVLSSHLSLGGAVHIRVSKKTADGIDPSLDAGAVYLDNQLLHSTGGGSGVDTRLSALTLAGCLGWGIRGPGALVVQPCASAVGGWLTARDPALTNPRSVGRSYWSLGALMRAAMPLGGGFSVHLDAGVGAPLVTRRFVTFVPDETVAETPVIYPALGVGVGYGVL